MQHTVSDVNTDYEQVNIKQIVLILKHKLNW